MFEIEQHGDGVASLAAAEAAEDVANPTDGDQQTVKRADQTEQHQRAGEIAYKGATIFGPSRHRVEHVGQGRTGLSLTQDPMNGSQKIADTGLRGPQQYLVGVTERFVSCLYLRPPGRPHCGQSVIPAGLRPWQPGCRVCQTRASPESCR